MVGKIMPNYIEVRQGDSFTILFQFKNDKKFLNIDGAMLKMCVKNKVDNKIVMVKQGIVDDCENGKAHISIYPQDTNNLNINDDYITDIQITFANGEVHTIYPQNISSVASFIISENVTE